MPFKGISFVRRSPAIQKHKLKTPQELKQKNKSAKALADIFLIHLISFSVPTLVMIQHLHYCTQSLSLNAHLHILVSFKLNTSYILYMKMSVEVKSNLFSLSLCNRTLNILKNKQFIALVQVNQKGNKMIHNLSDTYTVINFIVYQVKHK